MYDEFLDIIDKSVLFRGIEKDNIVLMLDCFHPQVGRYDKNEMIALAGEPFTGIGVLVEGEAAVIKETASGARVVMKLIKPGELFGEMIAFSSQSAWPATVLAQTESSAIFIPREKVVGECGKMCPWHRQLVANMLGILSDRALMLNRKLEYMTIRSMRGKLCAYLLDEYHRTGSKNLNLDMNRNELADYLNVSRPSMSREMKRMREEGLIDFHLSYIRILDADSLAREILKKE